MNLLDRYILSRFLHNFFSAFFILLVIFIFQGIWLFIDDLAGKGLGIVLISKFILYYIPTLVDRVLPLTVLLSSILTFGTFAEHYEFAAMKASGISLQRAMRSLILFVLLLGGVTFIFANTVIPRVEQKISDLKRNIGNIKPAAAITEGVFSNFEGTAEGMNIKVDRKYGDQDRFLDNVIIHKKANKNLNTTVIKAKTGELISSEKSNIIQLVLKNGNYYEELQPNKRNEKRKYPFAKSKFETYTINIDISKLNKKNDQKKDNVTTYKMKNVSRLAKDIDSLKQNHRGKINAFSKTITSRMGAFTHIKKHKTPNTTTKLEASNQTNALESKIDNETDLHNYLNNLTVKQQIRIINRAKTNVSRILGTITSKKGEFQRQFKTYNSHILSLHQKYALAFSCIVLFFVGAPLGAIIRKGGIGLPMVIAITLFLAYYFIGVFVSNYAKQGSVNPALGAWLSTLIMLPLGIFLTRRATADKGFISLGGFVNALKKCFKNK